MIAAHARRTAGRTSSLKAASSRRGPVSAPHSPYFCLKCNSLILSMDLISTLRPTAALFLLSPFMLRKWRRRDRGAIAADTRVLANGELSPAPLRSVSRNRAKAVYSSHEQRRRVRSLHNRRTREIPPHNGIEVLTGAIFDRPIRRPGTCPTTRDAVMAPSERGRAGQRREGCSPIARRLSSSAIRPTPCRVFRHFVGAVASSQTARYAATAPSAQ